MFARNSLRRWRDFETELPTVEVEVVDWVPVDIEQAHTLVEERMPAIREVHAACERFVRIGFEVPRQ